MASRTTALPLNFLSDVLRVLTYTIGNEEDADSQLVIIALHAEIVFEAIQTCVTDIDFTLSAHVLGCVLRTYLDP